MQRFDEFEKLWINLWWIISIWKSCSITNIPFPSSIEIEDNLT
jgi:hypothetical protein